MRQAPPKVRGIIEPAVTGLGYEVIGIEYLAQGKHSLLRIYIDSEHGITVEDCEQVSHHLSGLLDVEDVVQGHYNLEVSSPGLDRPLFTAAQFARYVGRQAKLRLMIPLEGRRNFKGEISALENESVVLKVDNELFNIPFNSIDKANLIPEIEPGDFKRRSS